jgi:hypothetical protein
VFDGGDGGLDLTIDIVTMMVVVMVMILLLVKMCGRRLLTR